MYKALSAWVILILGSLCSAVSPTCCHYPLCAFPTWMLTHATVLCCSCWDWWGYTEPNFYGTKSGVQPSFVRRLITAVTGA